MKLLLLSILFISSYSFGQGSFTASVPIGVASGVGNYHPQIEISGDGVPLVIWTEQGNKNLYCARHNGVDGFNTPIQLNPNGLDLQTYNWSGADISIDGDNVYVVFRSDGYETGHIYMVKSTDNGLSFGDTLRVDNLSDGFGQYPDIVAYQDSVWVTFMDHDAAGSNPQYVVARSTDGGNTFSNEVPSGALLSAESCDCCQPEIIVDDERVIVFFRNNDGNIRDIKAVISYDRGQTFVDWISVDNHNWYITACPSTGPDARFLEGDTTVTIYKSNMGGQAQVYINAFDLNAGLTIGENQITATSSTNSQINYPQISTENGDIGIVWEAAGGPGNGIDVFINYSQTGIYGLLPDNAVNISNSSGTQNKPDILVKNGAIHMVYADNLDTEVKYVVAYFMLEAETEESNPIFETFPNPADEVLNIKFTQNTEKGSISLQSMNGQEVYDETFMNINSGTILTINTSLLSKGIYLLKIEIDGELHVQKIVI